MINFPFKYKKDNLEIIFNWENDVIPCKKVKISLNGSEIILSRDEFSTLMAVFADENQMENIIQTNKTEFISIERMLKIKCQKDMKKDELLTFPYTYWITKTEYDELKSNGEMVKLVDNAKQSILDYVADNEAAKQMKKMWQDGKLSV